MTALLLRLAGMSLVLLGSLGTGMSLVAAGKKRLLNMQEILYRLTRMEGEIGFGRFSLPQVCRQCAEEGQDAFSHVLCRVAERMEANTGEAFSGIWKEELDVGLHNVVPEEFKNCLIRLGERLEVMDAALCQRLLQEACLELEQLLQRDRGRAENQNRVRVGLSMGAGMTVLLLLW